MRGNIKIIKEEFNYGTIISEGKFFWFSLNSTEDILKIGDEVIFEPIENGRFSQAIQIKKQ